MDMGLLTKLFGTDWTGPCTVIIDAIASVQTAGSDTAGASATKVYAPRIISGRVLADMAKLMPESNLMVLLQQQRVRQPTGEDVIKQTLTLVDTQRIVGVEFSETAAQALKALNLTVPTSRAAGSNSGVLPKPGSQVRPPA
jgi:hypothetical protein